MTGVIIILVGFFLFCVWKCETIPNRYSTKNSQKQNYQVILDYRFYKKFGEASFIIALILFFWGLYV